MNECLITFRTNRERYTIQDESFEQSIQLLAKHAIVIRVKCHRNIRCFLTLYFSMKTRWVHARIVSIIIIFTFPQCLAARMHNIHAVLLKMFFIAISLFKMERDRVVVARSRVARHR